MRGVIARTALSDLDLPAAVRWAEEQGLPAYRGRQLYHALWQRGVQNVDELSAFPRSLRLRLAAECRARSLEPRIHLRSSVDGSEKVLFALHDGATVETVLIRAPGSADRPRLTVCVSSQVGCPAACSFCATGLGGFTRNLTAAEIADQVLFFARAVRGEGLHLGNVVFMGMGEPFLNAPAVREAVARLSDPAGFNLGERHITVSTVGIVPQIRRFTEWGGQVNLAVSLHAPNDELRTRLVPYNARFPIADLMDAVREYWERTHRRVSFEYVLLRGINDDPALAVELGRLLKPLGGGAHVNLIPWNPFREGRFVRSEGPNADAFAGAVRAAGVNATIRYSRGLDISAACGQLREQARQAV